MIRRKNYHMLIMIVLIAAIIFTGINNQIALAEEGDVDIYATGEYTDIISSFSFEKVERDGNGDVINTYEYGPDNLVNRGDEVYINYCFNISYGEIQEPTDYILPALPVQLNIDTLIDNGQFKPLVDSESETLVLYRVNSDRTITLRFADEVKTGNLDISLRLNCSVDEKISSSNSINFNIDGVPGLQSSYDMYVETQNPEVYPQVEKRGEATADGIRWTITAKADTSDNSLQTLKGYVIEDTFDDKQVYKKGTFKVNNQDSGREITGGSPEISGQKITYEFPQSTDAREAVITFETEIRSDYKVKNKDTAVNGVVLKISKDEISGAQDDSSVVLNNISISKTNDADTEKKGYKETDDGYIILYKLDLNFSSYKEEFGKVTVTDDLSAEGLSSEKMHFVEGTFRYQWGGSDSIEPIPDATYKLDNDKQKLTVELEPESGETKVMIYYSVFVAKDSIGIFANPSRGQYVIKNKASMNLGAGIGASTEHSMGIAVPSGTYPTFGKIAINGSWTVSPKGENIMGWRINFNDYKKTLGTDAVITDTILTERYQHIDGKYYDNKHSLYLDEECKMVITMEDKDGKRTIELSSPEDLNKPGIKEYITYDEGTGSKDPVITFNIPDATKCSISYYTKINQFNFASYNPYFFRNTASVEFGNDIVMNTDASTWKYIEIFKKTGSYNVEDSIYGEKAVFDWSMNIATHIALHPNKDGKLCLAVTLPNGHTMIPGSLKYNNKGIVQDITDDESQDIYYTLKGNILTINFKKAIKNSSYVNLSTQYLYSSPVKNLKATSRGALTAMETIGERVLSPTVDVYFNANLKKQHVRIQGNEIEWQVDANDNHDYLTKYGAEFTDELQPGLEFVDGSLEFYRVDSKQTEVKLSEDENYTCTYDEEHKVLKVKLSEDMPLNEHYRFRFKTKVIQGGTFKNTVSFDGSAKVSETSSNEIKLVDPNIVGTISGDNIRLHLTKTDKTDNTLKLANAQFKLYETDETWQIDEKKLIDIFTSNDEGHITFNRGLKFGSKYIIKETESPPGYLLDKDQYHLTIGQQEDLLTEVQVTLEKGDDVRQAVLNVNGSDTLSISFDADNQKDPSANTTADVKVLAQKNVTGDVKLKGGEFEFSLKNDSGGEIKSASNNSAGYVTFGSLKLDIGTYLYTISEKKGSLPGWNYSDETIYVKVEVARNQKDNSRQAEIYYSKDGEDWSERNGLFNTITNEYIRPADDPADDPKDDPGDDTEESKPGKPDSAEESNALPITGDTNNIKTYLIIMLACAATVIVLSVLKYLKNKR